MVESEAKVTAVLPYFGGKRTLAPKIAEAIGKHKVYWEPFCGSMAVLLRKDPCTMETVNDLHSDVINLAHCIQNETTASDLYGRLSRTLMHEDIFREASEKIKAHRQFEFDGEPNVDRAYSFFVVSWMGMNGVAGTKSYNSNFCVRYTKNGGNAGTRFASAVDSIPSWHQRLRRVMILNRDAFELLEKIEDADGVVIYCDPPYITKGASYVHDFTGENHSRLAELLSRFNRTRVVVSYYDHPDLARLYPRWLKDDVSTTKSLVSQGKRDGTNKVVAPEVLLRNFETKEEWKRSGLFE